MGRLGGSLWGCARVAAGAGGAAGFCPSPSPGTEGPQHRPHPAFQPRIPLQPQPKLDPATGPAPPAAWLDGSQHVSCPGMGVVPARQMGMERASQGIGSSWGSGTFQEGMGLGRDQISGSTQR